MGIGLEDLKLDSRSPLARAAALGDLKELEVQFRKGQDPKDSDRIFKETPLHLAAMMGRTEVVKVLLKEYMVPIDPENWEGWTPFCMAVVQGHLDVVEFLRNEGANVNHTTKTGCSPMHLAAWADNLEITQRLMIYGVSSTAWSENNFGCLPTQMARSSAVKEMIG